MGAFDEVEDKNMGGRCFSPGEEIKGLDESFYEPFVTQILRALIPDNVPLWTRFPKQYTGWTGSLGWRPVKDVLFHENVDKSPGEVIVRYEAGPFHMIHSDALG